MTIELQNKLRKELRYDAETGEFFRAIDGRVKKAGEMVGHLNKAIGYKTVNWNGGNQYAHRLAWLYVYGYLPKEVDHINGVRSDNRLCNLREATHKQNFENLSSKPRGRNSLIGASYREITNRWSAQIQVEGRKKHLGYFDTENEAHSAYKSAKAEHHKFNPELRSE